jgi:RNase H-fold protein (predicted Holliday junction resolvase)
MRILALDHGTKRIGVAVSDETKTIAQPLEYIPAEPFEKFEWRPRLGESWREVRAGGGMGILPVQFHE